eukprot:5550278-Pleurochrysis_carterae.AAC.1
MHEHWPGDFGAKFDLHAASFPELRGQPSSGPCCPGRCAPANDKTVLTWVGDQARQAGVSGEYGRRGRQERPTTECTPPNAWVFTWVGGVGGWGTWHAWVPLLGRKMGP